MSVLIKGMEMPKACAKCLFFIESDSPSFPFVECKFIGRLGSVFNFIDDVPIDCPLIELPSHGRLIDADALMGRVNNAKLLQPEIADVYVDDYIIVRDWLHSAPTILEEEVE